MQRNRNSNNAGDQSYIAIKQSFAGIYAENNKETSTFLRIPVREKS